MPFLDTRQYRLDGLLMRLRSAYMHPISYEVVIQVKIVNTDLIYNAKVSGQKNGTCFLLLMKA